MGEGSTGQTELSRQRLTALEILIAPISVQQKIEEIAQAGAQKLLNNYKQNLLLYSLRDTFFPKLVSGQIRVSQAKKLASEITEKNNSLELKHAHHLSQKI